MKGIKQIFEEINTLLSSIWLNWLVAVFELWLFIGFYHDRKLVKEIVDSIDEDLRSIINLADYESGINIFLSSMMIVGAILSLLPNRITWLLKSSTLILLSILGLLEEYRSDFWYIFIFLGLLGYYLYPGVIRNVGIEKESKVVYVGISFALAVFTGLIYLVCF